MGQKCAVVNRRTRRTVGRLVQGIQAERCSCDRASFFLGWCEGERAKCGKARTRDRGIWDQPDESCGLVRISLM